MAGVTVQATITAQWDQQTLKKDVTTAQDLAVCALRILIEELGTDGAREFIRDQIAGYRMSYKGAGTGDARGPKKDST